VEIINTVLLFVIAMLLCLIGYIMANKKENQIKIELSQNAKEILEDENCTFKKMVDGIQNLNMSNTKDNSKIIDRLIAIQILLSKGLRTIDGWDTCIRTTVEKELQANEDALAKKAKKKMYRLQGKDFNG
jgi:uncharacterized protein YacL